MLEMTIASPRILESWTRYPDAAWHLRVVLQEAQELLAASGPWVGTELHPEPNRQCKGAWPCQHSLPVLRGYHPPKRSGSESSLLDRSSASQARNLVQH